MKTRIILTAAILTTAIPASLALLSTPAQAQDRCDLNGTDNGDNAADADDGATATATGTDGLACGQGASTTRSPSITLLPSVTTRLRGSAAPPTP